MPSSNRRDASNADQIQQHANYFSSKTDKQIPVDSLCLRYIRWHLVSFLYDFDSVKKYVIAFCPLVFPVFGRVGSWNWKLKLCLCLYYSISFDSNVWLFIIIIFVYSLVFVEFMMIEFELIELQLKMKKETKKKWWTLKGRWKFCVHECDFIAWKMNLRFRWKSKCVEP